MGGDAENRTPAPRRGGSTRQAVADRVEALTQPVPGHELADVRFERRTVIGPRSARVMMATVAALVVVVGGVMLFRDTTGGSGDSGDGGGGDVVAGLSPEAVGVPRASGVSGESGGAGVEPAGDTGGTNEATGQGETAAGAGPVVVSVQGMVHRPGLVTVDGGTRVGEVLDLSGGIRGDGRVEGVNLAEPVTDGMQVVVDAEGSHVLYPGQASTGEAPAQRDQSAPGGAAGTAATDAAGLVNLNTADTAALTSLSGVGPATAESIIAWREANGSFVAVEQLMEVKGIGPAKFEALRGSVTV